MILKNNKQKGFTIVELLIVIVVIGILAAISIVAYNGIQNRARDTAVADSAKQVRSKIETWNSIKGSYPTAAQLAPTGATTPGLADADAKEAELPVEIKSKINTAATIPTLSHDGPSMHVSLCTNGATITYFKSGTGANPTMRAGSGC